MASSNIDPTLNSTLTSAVATSKGEMQLTLQAAKSEIETQQRQSDLSFLTSDQDQTIDLSNPANLKVWRTGSGWSATRTITLANAPTVASPRIEICNNSDYDQNLTNGTGAPVDFPIDPFPLHRGTTVILKYYGSTSKLTISTRGWCTSGNALVPWGGVAGQLIAKSSSDHYDTEWAYPSSAYSASGLLDAENWNDVITTTGNITVPDISGFSCLLIMGGSHSILYNGTSTAALTAGDQVSVVVDHSSNIYLTKISASNNLALS